MPERVIVLPVPDAVKVRLWAIRAVIGLVILYAIWVVRDIWLPLALAMILATVLDPVVDRMEYRGWNRTWATAFIFGSFILIVGGLLFLATPYLIDQGMSVEQGFGRYFPDTTHRGLLASFHKMRLPDMVAQIGIRVFDGIQAGFQRSSSYVTEYGMSFISNLVWVGIIPIVGFYTLRDYHLILTKALLLIPKGKRAAVEAGVSEVTTVFARYLRGLMIVSGLNGLATWLLLVCLHVPSPLLLGIVAGLLYSVPYIGAMITIILTAAVAFVGGGVPMLVTAVCASMLMHQLVFDQIISPRVLGGHVGLHPIISIVALLAGNLLLGIVGMILAVPVAACIQIAVLAVVPKLASIEIPANTEDMTDTMAASLAEEGKGQGEEKSIIREVDDSIAHAVGEYEKSDG